MDHSPIILFTYKRLDTLQPCLASLRKCSESEQSDLIIVSDFAAQESDIEKVKAVRQFLRTIKDFKTIEIIERTQNLGVDYNIIEGIKFMTTRFPKFIVIH
jgi:GT2 family glycosyltransferase